LEALLDHLLVTPPSHFTPRKVRDFVFGFTWLCGGNNYQKNTLNLKASQGENCLPKMPLFSGQNRYFVFELLHSEEKGQKHHYRKELSGFGAHAPPFA
jgi:hypothetical protein